MGMFFDRRCPYCRVILSEYASKCPHCGEWLITESEKRQLDKAIQEDKKLKEQVESFITICVLVCMILGAIFVAIDGAIKGIKNTFFNKSKTGIIQEKVIEKKGVVNNEDDYNHIVRDRQQQASKPIQQAIQPKLQHVVVQPQEQMHQSSPETNVVVPQINTVQTQQSNEDINDFMY